MSDSPTRAVFLSYASKDVAAAQRIAEVLRAAGVEVWLDQNELGGGDAWDRKIRVQIGECALFVPVISATTQARQEGYFRLEWHLAEQRSLLIAKGRPFIVPVTIDTTTERGALVPEAFLAVQWTRLPGGETTAAFCARVKNLLGIGSETETARPRPAQRVEGAVSVKVGRALRARLVLAAAIAAVVLVGIFGWSRWQRKDDAVPTAEAAARRSARPTSEAAAPTEPRRGAKSIAVLPFDNLSEDKEGSLFFSDGMHQDVITNLLLIRELACVPHTTVMSYRGTKKTHREIAEELGVAYVLTGSVRRADKKVRITGTLINPRTDEAIWSKPYDKDLTDIFAIQAELAQAIAGEMKAVLSPQEKKRVEVVPTANVEAYDLFLKARELRNAGSMSPAKAREQEVLLVKAVTLDAKFGLAWAELARARSLLVFAGELRGGATARQAREALAAAERLIPGTPELFLSRGHFHASVDRDYAAAMREFEKALAVSPLFAEAHREVALTLRRQGQWLRALQALQSVERLDPRNPQYAEDILFLMLGGRRYAEAEAALHRGRELGLPESWFDQNRKRLAAAARGEGLMEERGFGPSMWSRFSALVAEGKLPEARARLEQRAQEARSQLESEPTNDRKWGDLGMMEVLLGNRAAALAGVRKAMELLPESKDAWWGPVHRVELAIVCAWNGDLDTALKECERVLGTVHVRNTTTQAMLSNVHAMRQHPAFAPLRGDPRFEAMLNDPKNNAPLF